MTTKDTIIDYIVKAIGITILVAFGSCSLYCFDQLPQKDKDFILIMLMMSQPQ